MKKKMKAKYRNPAVLETAVVRIETDLLAASVVDSIPAATSTGQDFTEYSFDEASAQAFSFSWDEE